MTIVYGFGRSDALCDESFCMLTQLLSGCVLAGVTSNRMASIEALAPVAGGW